MSLFTTENHPLLSWTVLDTMQDNIIYWSIKLKLIKWFHSKFNIKIFQPVVEKSYIEISTYWMRGFTCLYFLPFQCCCSFLSVQFYSLVHWKGQHVLIIDVSEDILHLRARDKGSYMFFLSFPNSCIFFLFIYIYSHPVVISSRYQT